MVKQSKEISWQEISRKKIIFPNEIAKTIEELKSQGKTIATINGSFDLMHAGHLQILFEASKAADLLVVCLNSDQSVAENKGNDRPIIPLRYRLEMMAALFFVDHMTWFDEADPREALKKIRPNIHVNGVEYGTNCIEKAVLDEIGATLYLVDRIEGLATSEIIQKILKCDSLVV